MIKLTDIFKSFQSLMDLTGLEAKHYWAEAEKSNAYITWQETGEGDRSSGDNRADEIVIQMEIELYVLDELDPVIDTLQELLDAYALSWSYVGSSYETTTNLIHHSWQCDFTGDTIYGET